MIGRRYVKNRTEFYCYRAAVSAVSSLHDVSFRQNKNILRYVKFPHMFLQYVKCLRYVIRYMRVENRHNNWFITFTSQICRTDKMIDKRIVVISFIMVGIVNMFSTGINPTKLIISTKTLFTQFNTIMTIPDSSLLWKRSYSLGGHQQQLEYIQ